MMAKIAEYLIGSSGSPSTARLCMYWGLVATCTAVFVVVGFWAFAKYEPNWALVGIVCAPGVVGLLPFTIISAKEAAIKAVENPEAVEKIAGAIKK